MAKFHLLYDCKKFGNEKHITPMEDYNSPRSEYYMKTMEIIEKYRVDVLAKSDKGKRFDLYSIDFGPNFVHTMLFDVKKTPCGGEFVATCGICGESRKFDDFKKAINIMYCQILMHHFHIPYKNITGEVSDLVYAETKTLRTYMRYNKRYGIDNQKYCTDKSDYACVACGMVYDCSAASSRAIDAAMPASGLIIDHIADCIRSAICHNAGGEFSASKLRFDPMNCTHDVSGNIRVRHNNSDLIWLVGKENTLSKYIMDNFPDSDTENDISDDSEDDVDDDVDDYVDDDVDDDIIRGIREAYDLDQDDEGDDEDDD